MLLELPDEKIYQKKRFLPITKTVLKCIGQEYLHMKIAVNGLNLLELG